jgi:hypothetical protein
MSAKVQKNYERGKKQTLPGPPVRETFKVKKLKS